MLTADAQLPPRLRKPERPDGAQDLVRRVLLERRQRQDVVPRESRRTGASNAIHR